MKTCTFCNKEIEDNAQTCPNCGKPLHSASSRVSQQEMSNALKVFIVFLICALPFGDIGGIIAGCLFMGNPSEDRRSFGKAILVLGIIHLCVVIICCVMYVFFGTVLFGVMSQMVTKIPYNF